MTQKKSFWHRFGKTAAIYDGGAVVVGSYGVPAVITMTGFTPIGITAGSFAAAWQATQFLPGVFGAIQSVTATNALGALITKVGVGAALAKAFHNASKDPNKRKMKKKPWFRSKL